MLQRLRFTALRAAGPIAAAAGAAAIATATTGATLSQPRESFDWKTAYRSFYYATADAPDDIVLDPKTTAVLVIDIQNTYLEPKDTPEEDARWQPFFTAECCVT